MRTSVADTKSDMVQTVQTTGSRITDTNYLNSTLQNSNTEIEFPQYGNSSQKTQDSNVCCVLQNKEMWSKFHAVGTEMIITKAGR